MLAILCLLAGLAAAGLDLRIKGWNDPFERGPTECVKGFFIGLVFVSHISGYLSGGGAALPSDRIARGVLGLLGQMIVVMFFVYSGYGVMKSIMTKGEAYVKAMPKRRIARTLFRFDIAVCAFLVLNILLGTRPGVGKIALSLVAWDSLGNSNWYIFAALLCYAVTWAWALAYRVPREPDGRAIAALTGAFVLCVVALSLVKESWWYDTMMAYPLGCIFAAREERIITWLRKRYWALAAGAAACFVALLKTAPDAHGIVGNMRAVVFGLLVVLAMMKARLSSVSLRWMGRNLFALYIYQRLPMIAFAAIGGGAFLTGHPDIYLWVSAASTLMIAALPELVNCMRSKKL